MGNNKHIFKSRFFQHSSYGFISRSMQRSINNNHILGFFYFLRSYRLLQYGVYKAVVNIGTYHIKKTCFNRFFLIYSLYVRKIRNSVYFLYYSPVFGRYDLRSVCPVYFISVILGRVMACRNNYAGGTSETSYRIRKFRSRTQFVEYIRLYSVGVKHKSGSFRKFGRHISGIIRYRNAHLRSVGIIFKDI